jgi:hypothetical protein
MDLIKRYKQQTPHWVELASDIFLIISTGTAGIALVEHYEKLALISVITGIVGKILARFLNGKQGSTSVDSDNNSTDHVCTCSNEQCECSSKGEKSNSEGV